MKVNCDAIGIEKATKVIKDGGIAVFPTDTVYGIGCDPFNKNAVDRIYEIKKRDKKKPFPILTHSMGFASEIVEFDKISKKIAEKFWPGPLTIILKLKDKTLKETLGLDEKIAIRVPNNKCLLNILKNSKFLVGTSANLSGEKSFTISQECYQKVTGYDVFVDGGDIENKGESTIVEIENGFPIIHRVGPIKKEEIEEYL
jgi:L-threonylcarbamoyladenylate synthase